MTDQRQGNGGAENKDQAAEAWQELLERSKQVNAVVEKRIKEDSFAVFDPTMVGRLFLEVATHAFADTAKLRESQDELAQAYARLWQTIEAAGKGERAPPVIEPERQDRRFKDEEWTSNPAFDAIKQYYLLTTQWLQKLVGSLDTLDPRTKQKAEFYTRQLISAMAPTNFVVTNPLVLRTAQRTEGESLRKGFSNLLDDIERGRGQLRISLTDANAFELGRNIATTPGQVIYRNELAELIQYDPSTEQVNRRPLLIVPPWINKYYVLDMQPRNSFLKWAVDQGHTVFVLSWVNPDETLADKSFDDYLLQGPMAALDAVREATGEQKVNAIGYCIGGTLLACACAHMAAKGDDRIASATFFTTMVDFSDPGELAVFIDDEQIAKLEQHMEKKGYLAGAQMAQVFSLLRENDLVWSAFVSNYLLGKDPPPFDLLYWNADSTRMPVMMHRFYLRRMYLENRLVAPDGLTIAGTPIDLRRITVPTYILSTREDHIAPWRSTFAATNLYSGPTRFVLAGSGHIAGVINPPEANKYGYWTRPRNVKSADRWLAGATYHEGSWWPHWNDWVRRQAGGQVPARQPGSGSLKAIEKAPGSYVRMRSAD